MNRLQAVPRRQRIFSQLLNYSTQISHASILLEYLRETKPLQQVHAQIIVCSLWDKVFLCNKLMNAYTDSGLILEAQIIFSQILNKNLFSWTILVSGLTKNGFFLEAIEIFYRMVVREIWPNKVTIASVLPAVGKIGASLMGKSVHCYCIKQNLEDNVFVGTALIDMYSKFGCMRNAWYMFDEMSVRNVVSWNAIIAGFSRNGFGDEALLMFNRMRREGFSGDAFTIMSLVPCCSSLGDLRIGRGIHGLIVRGGYENDQFAKTALMEMYIDCSFVNDTYCLFLEIDRKDMVPWTLMLRGFSVSGDWSRSIEHFNEMMREDEIMLDSVSLATILSCCSSFGSLHQGRRVHTLVIKTGFEFDLFVGSALIDMYGNCASMRDAIRHFEIMEEKDAACWNALISGYGLSGDANNAIHLLRKMEISGLIPDELTFVSVLCACSHAGLVSDGLEIFDRMVESWNVIPSSKHYACVIDLLARAGRVNDAYALVKRMDVEPGPEVYGSLLTACRIHKNFDLAYEISRNLFELKSNDAGYYVLLSNIHALAGNWNGVKTVRTFLKFNNLKKDPGVSSIEINGEMFRFMASQKDHSHYSKIEEFLGEMISKIKVVGYELDPSCVFQDVSNDVKEDILFHHSEKMAVAYGLMATSPGTNIRITKNLRICTNCHSACKIISKVYMRVLIVRDAKRFHVFEDGVCSCLDYW